MKNLIGKQRKYLSSAIVFLALPLFASAVFGQEPALSDAEAEAVAEARAREISRELASRQQAIEAMQAELGVYDVALMEAYADFAAFFTEIEDYENAVRLYGEALQLARINTGLFSEQQLPLINQLIQNSSQLKDWPEVDDLHELGYHLSSRLYQYEDPRYLAAVESYGSWKLRVVRENLLDQNFRGMVNTTEDLSEFYERAIANIEMQTDTQPESLLKMIYGKTQADLTLARTIASTPYTAFEGNVSRYINQARCINVRTANGQIQRQCTTVQVENPRYRQSQREAKQFALSRHTRGINLSIERLNAIKEQSSILSSTEKQQLESQIGQVVVEAEQLVRVSRRRSLLSR